MVDLFAVRGAGDTATVSCPEPGQVRDSISLAHADGVPAQFAVRRMVLRNPVRAYGRSPRQVITTPAALIVTDCRAALASSYFAADRSRMLVAHVRYSWLDDLAVAGDATRLRFTHPSGDSMQLTVFFASAQDSAAAAHQIARRFCARNGLMYVEGAVATRWTTLLATREVQR